MAKASEREARVIFESFELFCRLQRVLGSNSPFFLIGSEGSSGLVIDGNPCILCNKVVLFQELPSLRDVRFD